MSSGPPPPPPNRPPPPPHAAGQEVARRPSAPPPPAAPPSTSNQGLTPKKALPKAVWVASQSKVWEQAEILADEEGQVRVCTLQSKVETLLSSKDIHPVNPSVVEDMTSLHFLHEAGILYNLQERYLARQIYTYMGSALIALNPFAKIPSPNVADYLKGASSCPPHPYAIAENAFNNLNVLKRNQSIVISGESGAGKTETAKIIVKYLADRSHLQPVLSPASSSSSDIDELYDRLHGLSPILESFGNAKTTRNGNSSRFGKFMKLVFERKNSEQKSRKANSTTLRIIGAKIETYLLEKSRVTHQSAAEQNFHVFYALLHHPPAHLSHLLLDRNKSPLNFRVVHLLNQNSQKYLLDPSHYIDQIAAALKTLGLKEVEIDGIWTILVSLLYIGNVVFEEFDSMEGPVARVQTTAAAAGESGDGVNVGISGMHYLKAAAEMLKLDYNSLRLLLTQRQVETRGETFHVSLTVREANLTRDAVIKAIYEALFTYLVKVMNSALSRGMPNNNGDDNHDEFIGVLDIFGFESFDQNGYEQLLINYANEALQNTFNKQIFEREKRLFAEERIEVSIGDCPSNQGCVDLICKKGESILAKLDSISRQPNPSDARFCEELHKAFAKKSKYFGNVHRKDMANSFIVHHYAAHVSYQVTVSAVGNQSTATISQESSWIGKNNDSIPDGLEALYQCSGLHSFAALSVAATAAAGGQKVRRKSIMLKPTIAEVFSKSMNELNEVLESTNCHFIRCVKPNFAMKAGEYDFKYVVEQIRSLGILQTCEVLSVSLPTRVAYTDLMTALHPVVQQVGHLFLQSGLDGSQKNVLLISSLLRAFQIPSDTYRLGATIAFFRPGQLALLEGILNQGEMSSEREAEIVSAIESSIQQFKQLHDAIFAFKEDFRQLTEQSNHLERRQEAVQSQISRTFAESQNMGISIPEDIAANLNKIEHRFEKLRGKHNDNLKKHLLFNHFLQEKKVAANDGGDLAFATVAQELYHASQLSAAQQQISQYWQTFRESEILMSSISTQSSHIHQLIEGLEDSHGQDDVHNTLLDDMDKVNEDFEALLDLLATGQEQCDFVTIFAERVDVEKVKKEFAALQGTKEQTRSLLQSIGASLQDSEAKLKDLQEGKSDQSVNFQEVEQALHNTLTDLEKGDMYCTKIVELERAAQASVNSLSLLQASSAAASAEEVVVAAKPTPPPKPVKGRSGSINYSFKDLALLKQQRKSIIECAPDATPSSTEKSEEVESPLPPDWKEVLDPKTSKYYYVNKLTKERQWKRPVPDTAPEDVQSVTEEVPATPLESKPLPVGWREAFDKKTNRTYYINDATKERQWKRPEGHSPFKDASSRMSTRIESVDRLSSRQLPNSPEQVDRTSRRVASPPVDNRKSTRISADTKLFAPASQSPFHSTGDVAEEAKSRGRKQRSLFLSAESDSEELDEVTKQSVAYLMRLGVRDKVGYLSKQSKFLGRWRKRFFVLHGNMLAYYDSEKDYRKALSSNNRMAKAEKVFALKGGSITSFTTAENCFSITNVGEEDDEETSWYLFAETESDLDGWMRAINAHIHIQFTEEAGLEEEDHWDTGKVALSLWKVPGSATAGAQRRPVGIRTLPLVDGPRTGDGLYPGDIVEVNQIIEDHTNPDKLQRYLRLANDRGWVFENHPTANYAIMVSAGGELLETIRRYEYSANFLEPLCIYISAYCNADSAEEEDQRFAVIQPGEVVEGCAEWKIDSTQLFHNLGYTEYEDEDPTTLCFIKLRDGRGWVPMFHPVTAGKLLTTLS